MNKRSWKELAVLAVVAIALPVAEPLSAQQPAPPPPAQQPAPPLEPPAPAEPLLGVRLEREGAIRFASGGVGVTEREEMEALAEREGLNVRLVFAETTGAYVSNVDVTIRDRSGNVQLQTTTLGPWLYVRMPAGEYRVEARYRDTVRQAPFTAPATGYRQTLIQYPPGQPLN